MIRFINCVRKRTDISEQEFRKYWQSDEFQKLFDQVVEITKPVRHARNLTLKVDANQQIMEERGSGEPFDATIEYWWDNAGDLQENYNSPRALTLRERMLEYQEQFIDLGGCRAFFTEY